jgi:hypothetical protein
MFGKKRKTSRFYKRKEKRRKSSKLLEISIILLTLLLLVYSFSFFKKISQSEPTQKQPQSKESVFVRTQILNGCKREGMAERVADKLKGLRVENIIYDVIEIGNFEYSKTDSTMPSFILDRTQDGEKAGPSELALLTAGVLGISKDNVVCKKLENNYQEIELTIVIGNDYQRLLKR